MNSEYLIIAGLAVIMILTLALPFSVKKIEEELEIFLFLMGISAVTISRKWSWRLVKESLTEPIGISLAVLITGLIFKGIRRHLKAWLNRLIAKIGLPGTIFIVICFLGLGSSVFTAIISSLILAEIITILKLDRKYEVSVVIYACFAIGLGAALTPLGEPLSTIAIAKLKYPPHDAGFFYLLKLIGIWVVPGVLFIAFFASLKTPSSANTSRTLGEDAVETTYTVFLRTLKIFVFVMALIFLGTGLAPIAENYLVKIPTWTLYWANAISAILDNATLAAAEIAPSMSADQIAFLLMGLLISGGMLIPGNIPNIVSASKLSIKSSEWAKIAVPFGTILMIVYFVLLMMFL
ncbi:MAG: DUF1646 family protein [Elusimicrobia bacterium]|nr:DUF1646 family protein [Elusimicrobiota bacterium]